ADRRVLVEEVEQRADAADAVELVAVRPEVGITEVSAEVVDMEAILEPAAVAILEPLVARVERVVAPEAVVPPVAVPVVPAVGVVRTHATAVRRGLLLRATRRRVLPLRALPLRPLTRRALPLRVLTLRVLTLRVLTLRGAALARGRGDGGGDA